MHVTIEKVVLKTSDRHGVQGFDTMMDYVSLEHFDSLRNGYIRA